MSLTEIEMNDRVAILRLNNGTTNPLNPGLVLELSEELLRLEDDDEVNALLVTSSTRKFFSIGLAIPELYPMGREEFSGFLHSFNGLCTRLFSFPKPTVAALNGHAIAGGCVLALCFDYRFIASERKLMGLNEIKLGVPVPSPADFILQSIVGSQTAKHIMESGEFFPPDQSLSMGLVDEVHPADQLHDRALEKAKILGSMPSPAYGMIKQGRIEEVVGRTRESLEEKERYFVKCWFATATRKRLKEAMEKF